MIRDWQKYAEKYIDITKPFSKRGFVKDDSIYEFETNSETLLVQISEDLYRCELPVFSPELNILDFGCGTGRLPIAMDIYGVLFNSYTGVDVMKPSIDFLKEAFKDSSKHNLVHSHVRNSRYSPHNNNTLPSLPRDDYGLVVGWSVFTHQGHPANAQTALNWLVSNVADNCVFYLTWFKSPPNRRNFGEARSVYSSNTVLNMYKKAGLKIIADFGGDTPSNNNQWRIVAIKEK